MAIPSYVNQKSETVWEIPPSHRDGMLVPARMYGTKKVVEEMEEGVFRQLSNVACLPGIVGSAMCMPDGHWGYGFPIGGVAGFDAETGMISPGGIGFDINCGMRLIRTNLVEDEIREKLETIVDKLFKRIPAGVGGRGDVRLKESEFLEMTEQGMRWALRSGYAVPGDLEMTEENGCVPEASADAVSRHAVERGISQLGTLGSGNHYLEIQVAKPDHIYDETAARVLGIDRPNQVVIMVHCGSRGFGHQIASDYVKLFVSKMDSHLSEKLGDRDLSCAPFQSEEGQRYFAAMNCAINMAFVNRQIILHRIREVFGDVFHRNPSDLGLEQIYDVTHNTAKVETHHVDGEPRKLVVHRKGATRAFGPGSQDVPDAYRGVGQPVIIGGSMETGSYLLTGVAAGAETLFTTAHGSGRRMGRRQAKKRFRSDELKKSMAQKGIYIRNVSDSGLAEEAGGAYKDIDVIAEATELAGTSRRVAKLLPIGNIKG